jgi:hypothetical protein
MFGEMFALELLLLPPSGLVRRRQASLDLRSGAHKGFLSSGGRNYTSPKRTATATPSTTGAHVVNLPLARAFKCRSYRFCGHGIAAIYTRATVKREP